MTILGLTDLKAFSHIKKKKFSNFPTAAHILDWPKVSFMFLHDILEEKPKHTFWPAP